MIKFRRLGWTWQAARIEEGRSAFNTLKRTKIYILGWAWHEARMEEGRVLSAL